MNNQDKPDSAAPGGGVERMIKRLREIDGIRQAIGASDEIAQQYRDACCTFVQMNSEALIAALSAPKQVGVTDGWVSVNDRLPEEALLVAVYTPDKGDGAGVNFDFRYDGGWHDHDNSFEHYMAVGGSGAAGPDCICIGPSEQAPYTHWRDIGTPFSSPQPAPHPVEAEGREPSAWLVESGDYRQAFTEKASADAQLFELRKGGYEVSITPLASTPPEQPAIDLEQFRRVLSAYRASARERERNGDLPVQSAEVIYDEVDRLLDVIDGAKGGES